MRLSKPILTGILLVFSASCAMGAAAGRTTFRRPPKADEQVQPQTPQLPTLPENYPDSLAPVFYYTEGLKRSHIYKDSEAALKLFAKALEADSTYAPAYFEAAGTLMGESRDPERALEYSLKANRLDTANLWYKAQLGELYVTNGYMGKAGEVYEGLIARSPRNPDNYVMLAMLYEFAGQPFSAIATLDRAEAVLGKMEHLAEYKRKLLVDVKLYDRAIEESKSLVAIYPHNYEAHLSLAELYATTRKNDSLAEATYRRALELNPGSPEVIHSMNEFYKSNGNDAQYIATAKELFRNAEVPARTKVQWLRDAFRNVTFYRDNMVHIREMATTAYLMYPGDYEVLDIYSQTLIAWGDIDGALRIHKECLSDTISTPRPYMDIMEMEAYLGRLDSMEKYAKTAMKRFPRNSELHLWQGWALSHYAQDDKKAMKAYARAAEYSPDDSTRSVVLGIIGDMYHRQGRASKAFATYRKALEYDENNVSVLNNYAYYLSVVDQDLERALRMASRVMEIDGSNPTYIDTYGWVLYKLKRYEEAKKAVRQAIALDSDGSAELFMHYGDILFAMGDTYMATVYWKRGLDAGADQTDVDERMARAEKKE